MPYTEAPAAIKEKYGEKCARAYVHAFNSVYAKTSDEGKSAAAGHAAAQQCQGSKTYTVRRVG